MNLILYEIHASFNLLFLAMKNWHLRIIGYNKSMRYALSLLFILASIKAYSSPAEERSEFRVPFLDRAQEYFGAHTNFAANRLDSFFATERADDEFGRSQIRIRSRYNLRERAIGNLNNQYRINLSLPNLEQRFRYDFGEKEEKETRNLTSEEIAQKLLKRDQLNTSWLFNADMGVTASVPPSITTRARLRKNIQTGDFITRFAEQLTYVTDKRGLEEQTELNTDYIFNEDLVFRFINIKRWQIINKEFDTNHGPTILHRVSEDDAFIYGAFLTSTIEDGTWFVNNYRLSVNYRRNLYRQWLYIDLIPGLDFPKMWAFKRTPFLIAQLELLFGQI